jgi:hypothetical protein
MELRVHQDGVKPAKVATNHAPQKNSPNIESHVRKTTDPQSRTL